jgi:hypothetical protein
VTRDERLAIQADLRRVRSLLVLMSGEMRRRKVRLDSVEAHAAVLADVAVRFRDRIETILRRAEDTEAMNDAEHPDVPRTPER